MRSEAVQFWLCTSLLKPVQVPKVQLDIQSDSEQERHVAQAATQLVHKLLQSQLDGSDGLDAAHNTEFLRDLSSRYSFANSLLHMCKQGSLKSQHAALSVLQQFLVPEIWHQACATMRRRLISLGAVPTLLQIAASKVATADIQTLAESSLQGFHCDSDSTRLIGAFGMHSLVASMIFQSVTECRGTNQDYRSR